MTDKNQIRAALETFHSDAQIIEINDGGRKPYFFDTVDGALTAAAKLSARTKTKSVYFVVNPIDRAKLDAHISAGRRAGKHPRTLDNCIARRRWVIIDVDPVRPPGTNSNAEEKKSAQSIANALTKYLADRNWPFPITVDSGNGYHLYYRAEIPNDAEAKNTLKRFLAKLDDRFGGTDVNVDRTVFSAGQLMRLPGTVNRKGPDQADRPHRPVKLYANSATDAPVTLDQVYEIAGPAPERPEIVSGVDRLNVTQYLDDVGVGWTDAHDRAEFIAYELDACPFNPDHNRGEAIVTQSLEGALGFACKHHSCAGYDWAAFKEQVGAPTAEHYEGTSAADDFDEIDPEDYQPKTPIDWTPDTKKTRIVFDTTSAAELARTDVKVEYLVKGFLAAHQPFVLGGPKKVLKTSIALDLALALATGSNFLGRFQAQRKTVLMMTAESGKATIKDSATAIARTMGTELNAIENLHICETVPTLKNPAHQNALEDVIERLAVDVLIIDPVYMAMLGGDMANVFEQGTILRDFAKLCDKQGVTPVLLHHTRKAVRGREYCALDLDDFAGAGFGEFARQWLILNRREQYSHAGCDGIHRLWASWGGSAGHGNDLGLNIVAGVQPEDDAESNWRKWFPRFLNRADALNDTAQNVSVADATAAQRPAAQVGENPYAADLDGDDYGPTVESLY